MVFVFGERIPSFVIVLPTEEEVFMKQRNSGIDLIRIFLCLFVLLYHFLFHYGERIGADYQYFFSRGTFAVSAFFVISGYFSIYKGFLPTAKKKLLGLYLPYAISVLVIFSIRLMLDSSFSLSFWDLFGNLSIVPLFLGKAQFVDGAHWFVTELLLFNCVFFVVNLAAGLFRKRADKVLVVLYAFLFSFCFLSSFLQSDFLIIRIWRTLFRPNFCFPILGIFLRRALQKKSESSLLLAGVSFFALTIMMMLKWLGWEVFFFISFFLVFVAILLGKIQIPYSPVISFFGRATMYVYLFHQMLGYMIIRAFDRSLPGYFLGVFVATISMIALGLLVTWISQLLGRLRRRKSPPSNC